MRKKRQQAGDTTPPRLYSLTQLQAQALKEAHETEGGCYVPLTSRSEPMHELVRGGCAEYREVRRVGEFTRSVNDDRLCEWSDWYIVPTEWGLKLLNG